MRVAALIEGTGGRVSVHLMRTLLPAAVAMSHHDAV